MDHVATRFTSVRPPDITVIGDFVLDRYWHGSVSKVNPEGPGVVVTVDSETQQLGGAGGVAVVTSGLGISTSCFGAIGSDREGFALAQLINEVSDGGSVMLWTMPQTTVKHRIVANGSLLHNRFDFEEVHYLGDLESRLIQSMPMGKVVVIADYGKGVISESVMERITKRAHDEDLIVIVDPKRGRPLQDYGFVDLIKLNALEARILTGLGPMESAKELNQLTQCPIVVTDGGDGMFYAHKEESIFIGAQPAVVKDVTGAGDTVMAAIAVGMLRNYEMLKTLQFAAELAAKQVSQIGVCPVKESGVADCL